MTGIKVQITGDVDAKKFLQRLNTAIADQMGSLFRSLGDAYVADVKHRIISQDDGKWAPASKWLRAKSGQDRVLDGAERYVKARVSKTKLAIVSTARGWSLSQHDEGFENALADPTEKRDEHGRVVIPIKDGRPLNLFVEMRRKRDGSTVPVAQVFAFMPTKPGRTPARKIWPTEEEALRIGHPIASRWLERIVRNTGGSIVRG